MSFAFRGRVPASKSLLNRALVLASYDPRIQVVGDSSSDDVRKMRSALARLGEGGPYDCGLGGTTFRFLALRLSRLEGRHVLNAHPGLLARPQTELVRLLGSLGCRCRVTTNALEITGAGWRDPGQIVEINCERSSQFASAVLLNAWDLEFDLHLSLGPAPVSRGYFEMTLELCRACGMRVEGRGRHAYLIRSGQASRAGKIEVEPDMSTAFTVASFVMGGGRAVFESWPSRSLQPDARFCEFLARMGMDVDVAKAGECAVTYSALSPLRPIEVDLGNAPDLFPLLSVLCCFASGRSILRGAPQLAHKESHRIERVSALLSLLGFDHDVFGDGIEVNGNPGAGVSMSENAAPLIFDSHRDHRMAFAAALAAQRFANLKVRQVEAVDKSFPEFWDIVGKSAWA